MGFEDILKKRLGPMADLVARSSEDREATFAPDEVLYRRALGVELRVRPEDALREVQIAAHGGRFESMRLEDARVIAGLTRWTSAADLDVKPRQLQRWVEADLLHYAPEDPGVALAGEVVPLDDDRRVARRASAWPTLAMEDAASVAPIPFMPRAADLDHAELVGLRLSSRQRGVEVFGLTITGSERTGRMLRALLPLLDGRLTPPEIVARFDRESRAVVRWTLELLSDMTMLETSTRDPALQPRLTSGEAPQLTWLGHAAVLVQTGAYNILVDPLFFAPSDPPERWLSHPRFDPRTLPDIDAVLITHGDNDHLNPNALAMLPRDVQIIVPRLEPRPAPYQVDVRGLLKLLGFDDVVEVDAWGTVQLGEVTITACPFVGEDWGLQLPQATFLVQSPELSCFFSADAARMDDVYQRLRDHRVDVAFMGVAGSAETYASPRDFGYGNFYAEWIPRARRNQWVQHCASPVDAARSAKIMGARYAFGYACGGASYIKTSFSDTGDHAQLAEHLGDGPVTPVSFPLGTPVTLADLEALPRGSS